MDNILRVVAARLATEAFSYDGQITACLAKSVLGPTGDIALQGITV